MKIRASASPPLALSDPDIVGREKLAKILHVTVTSRLILLSAGAREENVDLLLTSAASGGK